MSEPLRRPFDGEPQIAVNNDPPKVFVRVIVTPPGTPWEQARVATLDVRHGAPLPLAELIYRMKRLSRWAPGRPGRFAVFYVRAKEFRGPFETAIDVEGEIVNVAFGMGGEQVLRARRLGLLLLLFLIGGSAIGAGATVALNVRAQTGGRLEANEKLAATQLSLAKAHRRGVAEAQGLRTSVGAARDVGSVLEDLTWVATAKAADARIVGVHWDSGVLAVEARGDQMPFVSTERTVERSASPLRSGVWLWGVGSRRAPALPPASTVAGP